MNDEIEKLAKLVRLRGWDRSRREQALAQAGAEHEDSRRVLRGKQHTVRVAEDRYAAAVRARSSAPGDPLLADYCNCERDGLAALSQDAGQARVAEQAARERLDQVRRAYQRALARLEMLESRLREARMRERRRSARRKDDALADIRCGAMVAV